MKHPWVVTLTLLILFVLSHILGLYLTDHYLHEALPYDIQRPELEQDRPFFSTAIIIGMILVATIIILLLAKFKLGFLWKVWFGLAVLLTLSVAFNAFMPSVYAFILALLITLIKIFSKNYVIHNVSEMFVYAALAAIFAPIFTVTIVILILFAISIYDFIAVNKTKHMITLAEFQSKQNLFAGFTIPYKKKDLAILGGGDVVFPLLFAGVLFPKYGYVSLVITFGALLGLGVLFYLAKKKTYYPAMPFVTAGCLVGYGILLLL